MLEEVIDFFLDNVNSWVWNIEINEAAKTYYLQELTETESFPNEGCISKT